QLQARMTAAGALLLWMAIGVAQTPEDSLRAAVTDYYAALEHEDLERVLAFWAPGAERAPDRPSLVTLFTTGDDRYVVTITRAAVDGDRGRVRVIVDRARTLIREGVAVQAYSSRAARDRTAEIETLQNLANAHYFQRHYEQAQEYYLQRLALAREMNGEPAIATSELGIATAMYSRAEYSAALTYYRSALARLEAA